MDTYKIERLLHLLMERLDRQEKMIGDLIFRSQRQMACQEEDTERKIYNGERLYDNQDLCLMLQVSKRSLQRYRSMKILPYIRIGRKSYYKVSDVREFIKEHGEIFRKGDVVFYETSLHKLTK